MPSATTGKKQPRQKHVPQRMCAVCRETNAKRTLTRIVRTSDTSFDIDPTGRANGRGAYICDNPMCWEKAASTPILTRALRVTPDEESIQRLREFAAGVTQPDSSTVGSEEIAP